MIMWWRRGAKKPDIILSGPDSDRITHAFEVEGLGEFEALMRSRQSYYRPFMTTDSAGFPREYPARWSFTTDRSSYSPGETDRISLQIENVSVLPLARWRWLTACSLLRAHPGSWSCRCSLHPLVSKRSPGNSASVAS